MKKVNQSIQLPEGSFNVSMDFFDQSDFSNIKSLYNQWNNLSNLLVKNGGRRLNIPEVLSEGIVCIHFGAGRLTASKGKFNSSWDCYQINNHRRIQVKATSVGTDLTSFGPRSVWDDLYFVSFFPYGKYDGSYEIFKIPNNLIHNFQVSKTQTFKQQQKANRRPRFSIINGIIKPQSIKPIISNKL